MTEAERVPRRFRFPTVGGKTPTGVESGWNYGCYFPATDLVVTDMGLRGTGEPTWDDLEWIDRLWLPFPSTDLAITDMAESNPDLESEAP